MSGRAPAPINGAGARPATERAAVREHQQKLEELQQKLEEHQQKLEEHQQKLDSLRGTTERGAG